MVERTRKHEEYLESTEPVAVVVVNNLSYIMEDLGELLLDVAKLQRKRPQEFMDMITKLAPGPKSLPEVMPDTIAKEVQASFFGLMTEFGAIQKEMAAGKEGGAPTGPMGMDPQNLTPEQLEKMGNAIKQSAENINKVIREYEATLVVGKK